MTLGDEELSGPVHWRRTIFDVVDEAYYSHGGLPPGTIGRMFSALDRMRAEAAEADVIARAEAIAVTLHRLVTTMRAAPRDDEIVKPIRRELRGMGVAWLNETRLSL